MTALSAYVNGKERREKKGTKGRKSEQFINIWKKIIKSDRIIL
jgi:hypothetical protein